MRLRDIKTTPLRFCRSRKPLDEAEKIAPELVREIMDAVVMYARNSPHWDSHGHARVCWDRRRDDEFVAIAARKRTKERVLDVIMDWSKQANVSAA